MDKSKVVVDLGVLNDTGIGIDFLNPIHIRNSATLDHELDGELVKKAWDKIKRVYPVVDLTYKMDHGDKDFYFSLSPAELEKYLMDRVYLVEAESGTNDPIRSKVPIEPCSEACGKRLICISYYDRTVTVSAFHALVDGGGLDKIFTAFLYVYLAMYTGHEDENPIVDLTEGRSTEEYYKAVTSESAFSHEYTPVPIYTLPLFCTGYIDEDMVRDDEGAVYSASISVPIDEFIGLCKKNGTNPSSMMCTLLAKAAYALNPNVKEDIVFDITVSVRKLFGLENSVANVITLATSYVSYDDIMNKTLAEVSGRIRKEVNTQRTKDYCISFRRVFSTYKHTSAYKPRTITYMGTFDIGDNNKHIVYMEHGTCTTSNLFMVQLNDKFIINIYHGLASEKYMNEFIKIFSEFGIKAEVIKTIHKVDQDSKIPVL